jgi:hypothetical protein
MSIAVSWFYEPYIIEAKGIGQLSLTDMQQLSERIVPVLDLPRLTPIYLFFDQSSTVAMPGELDQIVQLPIWQHRRLAWTLIYGSDDVMIHLVSHVISQVSFCNFQRLANRAEAVEFVASLDRGLELGV